MTKYFGNTVTVTIDGTTVGQAEVANLPEEVFDRVDFTGLGDTFEDTKISPVQTAVEFTLTVFFDRSDTDWGTIEGKNGTDTSVDSVFTFPWSTNNTATVSTKIIGLGNVEAVSREALKREITLVTTGTTAWSTV